MLVVRLGQLFLLVALLQASACAGVYLPPASNVPALRKAGQATLSGNARAFVPESGTHAMVALALTDVVRAAGTLSRSFDQRPGVYGEGLLGGEPMLSRLLQLGVLGGVGYGDVTAKHRRCRDGEGGSDSICTAPGDHVDQASASYVRYSLQAYLAAYAPKIFHGGGGLRLAVIDMRLHEIDDMPVQHRAYPIAIEPFVFGRVGLPWLQAEAQLRYTGLANAPHHEGHKVVVSDQFSFMLGARLVLGPGIAWKWPRRWRYE